MLFLLDAQRMTKGMAKLRQWLVLLMRTLVIMALIFILTRPVAGLWLGNIAGSSTDTTLILLDRSASMEQRSMDARISKRQTALAKLTNLLENIRHSTNLLIIDSATLNPVEVHSPNNLDTLTEATPTSTIANIPEMVEAALDYIEVNQTGQTDIWLCSDLQQSNWQPASPRWESIRSRVLAQKALRIFLLNYTGLPQDDLSVTATSARLHKSNNQAQILLDATLRRNTASSHPLTLPVQILVNGKRSVHNIEIKGSQYSIQAIPIPIQDGNETGWGRIELPLRRQPLNNVSNFLIAEPPVRKSVTISETPAFNQLIEIATSAPPDPYLTYETEKLTPAQANQIDWDTTALLCWQAPSPPASLPSKSPTLWKAAAPPSSSPHPTQPRQLLVRRQLAGWDDGNDSLDSIRSWRTDSGILQNSLVGKALPVGKLKIFRNCRFEGDATANATLESGADLLARVPTNSGNAWFCGTLPQSTHSSLAQDGIAFYVLLHRALETGAAKLGNARIHHTGHATPRTNYDWTSPEENPPPESTRHLHSGVYLSGEQWIAYNRPPEEDTQEILSDDILASLFEGLPWQKIEDQAGSTDSITSEVWRIFVYLMAAAAILEALLCLPKQQTHRDVSFQT